MRRRVPIGELGEIVSGATPRTHVSEYWNGDIPWVTPADLTGHEGIFFRGMPAGITKAGLDSCSAAIVPKGTILFSSRAPIGHCAVAEYPLCTNQGFKNLVPNSKLDSLYGYFALKFITPEIVQKGRGATFAEVNKEMMEETLLPYCELPEQKRIAELLEQADRVRRIRHYALELCDEFLSAAFLSLFGDLKVDLCPWPFVPLGDHLSAIEGGVNFTPVGENEAASEWRVLKVSAVSSGEFRPEESKPISPTETFAKNLVCELGDLIMSRANTLELVGAIARIKSQPGKVLLPDKLWKLRFKGGAEILPDYVLFALRTQALRREIEIRASGTSGSMKNISKEDAASLRLPVPPLAKQRHFASLVAQHERLHANQFDALRQAEHLFDSLLSQAFSNEFASVATIIELQSSPEFIRAVLAAEITDRLSEDRFFGQTKLQKVIYLVEHIFQLVEINSHHVRYARGPHDPDLIKQVEHKMRGCEWYETVPRSGDGYGHQYHPLAQAGDHRGHFEKMWPKQAAGIRRLIDEMKSWKTERCERFATVYAAWNDLLHWEKPVTDSAILEEVLEHWHPDKLQIPKAKWIETLGWMRHEGYIPNRFGHPTAPKPQPELFSTGAP
jgi:type I restriction enzyme S subunit